MNWRWEREKEWWNEMKWTSMDDFMCDCKPLLMKRRGENDTTFTKELEGNCGKLSTRLSIKETTLHFEKASMLRRLIHSTKWIKDNQRWRKKMEISSKLMTDLKFYYRNCVCGRQFGKPQFEVWARRRKMILFASITFSGCKRKSSSFRWQGSW